MNINLYIKNPILYIHIYIYTKYIHVFYFSFLKTV